MKKFKRIVFVSFLVLIVLVGFYFVIKKNPKEKVNKYNKTYFTIKRRQRV